MITDFTALLSEIPVVNRAQSIIQLNSIFVLLHVFLSLSSRVKRLLACLHGFYSIVNSFYCHGAQTCACVYIRSEASIT